MAEGIQDCIRGAAQGALKLGTALITIALTTGVGRTNEYQGGPLRTVAHFDIVDSSSVVKFVPTQTNAAGDVYYSNISNPTGAVIAQGPAALVSGNGMTRLLADDILTAVPGNSVIELTFSVANTNVVTVTARPRFRFWNANGTGGGPGTYLGTVGLTFPSTPFPPGVTVTTGGIPTGVFPMPGSKFWVGMVLDNANGATGATLAQLGAMGQAVFDPPTRGSSPDIPFITNSAGSFLGTTNPAGSRVSQTSGPKVSLAWKFADTPCPTITASAGPDGTISPSGAAFVACGASATFTISPVACYRVADVLVDGVSVGAVTTYTFTNVIANHTIAASFAFASATATDADGDGLLDEWETLGVPFADGSSRYLLPGADPQHHDLYLELDAMSGHLPNADALADVVAAFAASPVCNPDHTSGVRLHLVGNGCDPCLDQTNVPEAAWPSVALGAVAVWDAIHGAKQNYFGTDVDRLPADRAIRLAAKARAFRWVIFGKSIGGPTGIAEAGGDVAVTVAPDLSGISRDKWAGTLMHELGHSLGLGHGGRVNGVANGHNFKPNYYSVMNYLWQWPAPATFLQSPDRAFAWRSSWRLDYSRARMNPLVDQSLDETAGLGGPSGNQVVPIGPPKRSLIGTKFFDQVHMNGPVDYDGNTHSRFSGYGRDIDNFGIDGDGDKQVDNEGLSSRVLEPAEDWSVLQYALTEAFTLFPTFAGVQVAVAPEVVIEMSQDMLDSLLTLHFDCNDNEIEDAEEIASGTIADADANGIPDECEGLALILPVPDRTPAGSGGLSVLPRGSSHEVRFAVSAREHLTLAVHDLTGRRIAVLADGVEEPGEHVRLWPHRDQVGNDVRPGVYFVILQIGERRLQRRAIVLR